MVSIWAGASPQHTSTMRMLRGSVYDELPPLNWDTWFKILDNWHSSTNSAIWVSLERAEVQKGTCSATYKGTSVLAPRRHECQQGICRRKAYARAFAYKKEAVCPFSACNWKNWEPSLVTRYAVLFSSTHCTDPIRCGDKPARPFTHVFSTVVSAVAT